MRYKQRRRLYSQNFIRSPKLIKELVRQSSIGSKDLVLEIGPGTGFITRELVKVSKQVIAVEIDHKLTLYLRRRFSGSEKIKIYNKDFLNYKLPLQSFKVFANIPFRITADIIRKLTNDNNFTEAYLIIQKEAAYKFIGKPFDYKNSMISVLLKPWFEISIFHTFSRYDFVPVPSVNIVMIKIEKREMPLVKINDKEIFKDFIAYTFNRIKAGNYSFSYILESFRYFKKFASSKDKIRVAGEFERLKSHQSKLQKINRTRKDKDWRKY